MNRLSIACLSALVCLGTPASASARDLQEATLVIRGHAFVPAVVRVPADRKIRLTVINQDASAEEFESYELNREKVVAGNSRVTVFVGPLARGRYPFFGDFHRATAKGTLVVE